MSKFDKYVPKCDFALSKSIFEKDSVATLAAMLYNANLEDFGNIVEHISKFWLGLRKMKDFVKLVAEMGR